MLAVLDAIEKPKTGAAARLLSRLRRYTGVTARYEMMLGAPVLYILIETEQNTKPRTLQRRFSAAMQILDGAEACRDGVCYSDGFPYSGFFTGNGYPAPDLTPLFEAVASQVVQKLPGEGKTAFFASPRLNDASLTTLTALCRIYRFVLADIARGDAGRLRELQRNYGVSIVENPSPERLLTAESAVFMGPRRKPTELTRNCIVFAVNDAALKDVSGGRRVTALDIELSKDNEDTLPKGFPRAPLTANALLHTSLPYGAVILRGLGTADFQLDKA